MTTQLETTATDPVSIEIHRKSLENIVNEMAIALTRTSGSPVIYEVQDFATSLLDAKGEHLAMSATILIHAGSSLLGTRAVIASLGGDAPRPGDGWIVNDPFEAGAQHQADLAIIMPTFYGDEHVGWAFTNVHTLDIGGMGVSGFAPSAKSVYEEGLRFAPTKIVREGSLDPGWVTYFHNNVRIADLVVNDIRAMIAANNVAQLKLSELIDRFGLEEHRRYCEISKSLTEEAFRARISKLPDGIYETSEWVEYDGHDEAMLLEIACRMQIEGSEMRLSFAGSPQVDAFVNATTGVVYGGLMTTVRTTLGYGDLPFNHGMWRPLTIDLGEPGTVVNAVVPAPVSSGHAQAGLRITRAVKEVLNQACGLSDDPELRGRVGGMAHDACVLSPVAGIGHGGAPTVAFFMDLATGNGGGAQSGFDGQDCYALTHAPGNALPNVETNEAHQPALYLWRRLVPNSGGAGLFRGGQGLEMAYSIYGSERLAGAATAACTEAPARGAGGGLPGGAAAWRTCFGGDVHELLANGLGLIEAELNSDANRRKSNDGRLELKANDVMTMRGGGGGGLGDPLMRSSEAVVSDLLDGYITEGHARSVYGVSLADGDAVDVEATDRARASMRRARLGAEPTATGKRPTTVGVSVVRDGNGSEWACGYCGSGLGDVGANWRSAAVTLERPLAEVFEASEVLVRARTQAPVIMLAERFCPSCAGLLASETYPEGFSGFSAPHLGDEPPGALRLGGGAAR